MREVASRRWLQFLCPLWPLPRDLFTEQHECFIVGFFKQAGDIINSFLFLFFSPVVFTATLYHLFFAFYLLTRDLLFRPEGRAQAGLKIQ